MHESVYFGYYLHLHIDKVFFSGYLPQVVEYLDENGHPAELRRGICSVRLKETGQLLTPKQYLSEEYYYGDYTKMNTWLCEQYHLPENLYLAHDPGIVETDYSKVGEIIELLKEYRKVPTEAVRDVRVFDVERLMKFLEKRVREVWER